jgi:hypothetical protein
VNLEPAATPQNTDDGWPLPHEWRDAILSTVEDEHDAHA